MRRIVAALVPATVGLAVSAVVVAPASGDDGPALTPPAITAPANEPPPGEFPRALESTPIPRPGAVLVVPGITTPRSGHQPRPVPTAPRVDDTSPPLVGPDEMREAAPITIPSRAPSRPLAPRSPTGRPPITLESVPESSDDPTRRGPSEILRGTPSAPRRPGGFFGRLFAPPVALDRLRSRDEVENEPIKVEPRSDPAADAALKRRVETQIRESLAGKLRSYEVRVIGRDVVISARAARFWQKRAVRNTLDSLPALSGYKARIEVLD